MWRVDYAAAGHPWWLSLEAEGFDDVWDAVKMAQKKLERWEKCEGWRVVKMTTEAAQKITDEHLFQIVVEGQRVYPWSLAPMPRSMTPEERDAHADKMTAEAA